MKGREAVLGRLLVSAYRMLWWLVGAVPFADTYGHVASQPAGRLGIAAIGFLLGVYGCLSAGAAAVTFLAYGIEPIQLSWWLVPLLAGLPIFAVQYWRMTAFWNERKPRISPAFRMCLAQTGNLFVVYLPLIVLVLFLPQDSGPNLAILPAALLLVSLTEDFREHTESITHYRRQELRISSTIWAFGITAVGSGPVGLTIAEVVDKSPGTLALTILATSGLTILSRTLFCRHTNVILRARLHLNGSAKTRAPIFGAAYGAQLGVAWLVFAAGVFHGSIAGNIAATISLVAVLLVTQFRGLITIIFPRMPAAFGSDPFIRQLNRVDAALLVSGGPVYRFGTEDTWLDDMRTRGHRTTDMTLVETMADEAQLIPFGIRHGLMFGRRSSRQAIRLDQLVSDWLREAEHLLDGISEIRSGFVSSQDQLDFIALKVRCKIGRGLTNTVLGLVEDAAQNYSQAAALAAGVKAYNLYAVLKLQEASAVSPHKAQSLQIIDGLWNDKRVSPVIRRLVLEQAVSWNISLDRDSTASSLLDYSNRVLLRPRRYKPSSPEKVRESRGAIHIECGSLTFSMLALTGSPLTRDILTQSRTAHRRTEGLQGPLFLDVSFASMWPDCRPKFLVVRAASLWAKGRLAAATKHMEVAAHELSRKPGLEVAAAHVYAMIGLAIESVDPAVSAANLERSRPGREFMRSLAVGQDLKDAISGEDEEIYSVLVCLLVDLGLAEGSEISATDEPTLVVAFLHLEAIRSRALADLLGERVQPPDDIPAKLVEEERLANERFHEMRNRLPITGTIASDAGNVTPSTFQECRDALQQFISVMETIADQSPRGAEYVDLRLGRPPSRFETIRDLLSLRETEWKEL